MARGTLRIYLGMAPGVGKTFAMLGEGHRRADRGTDVVVAYVETHGRQRTIEAIGDLVVVPRSSLEHRGASFPEMDIDAVLARRPDLALVDELAHTNAIGSRNTKRWEDIDELLAAGIDVISTVNVQHLESLNDVVKGITGVLQQETVPDGWVRAADQIELVDMAPEALRRRLAHGNVYAPEKVDPALGNYFRVGNLTALRELALLWLADKVEESLGTYMDAHGITATWATRERVVVALTGRPSGEQLIRRGAQMSRRRGGDLLGVHVRADDGLTTERSDGLLAQRALIAELGGTFHEVAGVEPATALVAFARSERATQIVLGASRRSRWRELARGSVINEVIRRSQSIDVHVITATDDDGSERPFATARRRRPPGLPVRRQLFGGAAAALLLPGLTMILAPQRSNITLGTIMLAFLAVLVGVAAVGGIWPALGAAIAAFLLVNWFFTPPIHTWTIGDAENVVALVVFVVIAATVAVLVDLGARRGSEAGRARAEAEALAEVAGGFLAGDDPLPALLAALVRTFGLDGAAVLRDAAKDAGSAGGIRWKVTASFGSPTPASPADADLITELPEGSVLAVRGRALSADDRRVLSAFTAQLGQALEARALRARADTAAVLAEGNQLRTALLSAVSHDLRSPLTAIKAAAAALLDDEIVVDPDDQKELLRTIDEETDRLDVLVANLLDMSRLQTGGLQATIRPAALDEVLPGALAGLPRQLIVVDARDDLPLLLVDPGLLERVLANVIANAVHHGAASIDRPVRVEASPVPDPAHPGAAWVDVRIVDRGRGIPVGQREAALQPFQRLGDAPRGTGVGLGLAVAHGFAQAIGADLTLEDTPGGGLTAVVRLPTVPDPVLP